MTFKTYDNNAKRNMLIRNNKGVGLERVIEHTLESVVNKIKADIIDNSGNELIEEMKLKGITDIDEYVLSVIDETVIIENIEIKLASKYTEKQVDELNKAKGVLSEEEMNFINGRNIDSRKMKKVRESIEEGLPFEKIKMININNVSEDSLSVLLKAIKDGFSMEELELLTGVSGSLGAHTIIAVRNILNEHGIESAKYATQLRYSRKYPNQKVNYTTNQVDKISLALSCGIPLDEVKELFYGVDETLFMDLLIDGMTDYGIGLDKMLNFKRNCVVKELSHIESYELLLDIRDKFGKK